MPNLVIDSQGIALLMTAAITFSIGAFAGFFVARSRLSEVEFCKMQLRAVSRAAFQKQRLMNFSEFQIFRVIEGDAAIRRAGYRLVAQAPLGEILQSKHANGFRAVNGKRVDMLIVDRGGWPLLAIEYQGEGHYDDTSDFRDAIKKSALTKAGVAFLELFPQDKTDPVRLLSLVYEKLGWTSQAPNNSVHHLQDQVRAAQI